MKCMRTPKLILAVNTGSSSVKFSCYRMGERGDTLFSGSLTGIGTDRTVFSVRAGNEKLIAKERVFAPDHERACIHVFSWIMTNCDTERPDAIGHRMVHGGSVFSASAVVTPALIELLAELSPFASEHQPRALNAVNLAGEQFPGVLQVVCFDTAFHSSMPIVASLYPLPKSVRNQGVQRYGFHGLSCEYLLEALQEEKGTEVSGEKIIFAHLGNGASITAVRDGKSIDTTMGFSPAGGLVMGTRTGDLDPGVMLFLMEQNHMTVSQIKDLVNRHSGLLGVSGISSDMRDLLELEKEDDAARYAIELFCYQARKNIGALTAVLGGLNTLVFTGGIGEHSSEIRTRICKDLEYLGITIDEKKNCDNKPVISKNEGIVSVKIINTNEELMIARHTYAVLTSGN